MPNINETKCDICRAKGTKLFLKGERCTTKCPIDKKGAVPPGQHATSRRRRRISDYGIQLKEKQKLKAIYGLGERQLKNYFVKARQSRQDTSTIIFQILESRLDNTVFRLGFAPSRRAARQIVSHKHVLVDGKTVNIPSFLLKTGQTISLDVTALASDQTKQLLADKKFTLSPWLDRQAAVGKITRLPERDELDNGLNEQLIIEYYSR